MALAQLSQLCTHIFPRYIHHIKLSGKGLQQFRSATLVANNVCVCGHRDLISSLTVAMVWASSYESAKNLVRLNCSYLASTTTFLSGSKEKKVMGEPGWCEQGKEWRLLWKSRSVVAGNTYGCEIQFNQLEPEDEFAEKLRWCKRRITCFTILS